MQIRQRHVFFVGGRQKNKYEVLIDAYTAEIESEKTCKVQGECRESAKIIQRECRESAEIVQR